MAEGAITKKPLNFKMGLLENLKKIEAGKNPGTIYVTTDEKAMYLDIEAGKRIRLGSAIRVVDNIPALTALQPWEEGALYYAAEEDVMVIYHFNETENKHEFLHVNKKVHGTVAQLVEDLAAEKVTLANLVALVGTVKDLPIFSTGETDKTVHNALLKLHNRVNALETVVGDANNGLVKDVAALKTTVGDAENGLVKQVADLEEAVGDLNLGDVAGDLTALGVRVGTLETWRGTHTQEYNTLVGRVDAHDQTITTLATKEELKSAKSDLQNKIDAVDELADGIKSDLAGEVARATNEEARLAGLIGEHDTRLTATEGVANAAKAKADTNAQDISRISGVVGDANSGLVKKVADLESYKTSSSTDIATIKANITALGEKDAAIEGRLNGHDTTLGELAAADATLEGKITSGDDAVKELLNSAKTELQDNIDGLSGTVNQLKLNLEAADKKLGEDIAAVAKDLADTTTELTGSIGANTQAITDINTVIGDDNSGIKKDIKDLKAEDSGIKQRLNALESLTGDSGLSKLVEDLQNNKADKTALAEEIGKVNKAITDHATEADGKYVDKTSYASDKQNLSNQISGVSTQLSTFVNTTAPATYATITSLNESVETINGSIDGVSGRVTTLEGTVGNASTGLVKKVNDIDGTVSGHTTSIGTLNTTTAGHTTALNNILNGTAIDSFKDTEDEFAKVRKEITDSFAANDALVFKGVLASGTHANPNGIKSGWTYKASSDGDFTLGGTEFKDCKTGDLFIYVDGTWQYVPSGNEDRDTISLKNNGANLYLHSVENNVAGGVTFVKTAGTAIEITPTEGQIAIGMFWDTFE